VVTLDWLEAVLGIQRLDDARPGGRRTHTDGA
jgi:hypothetical protein